MARFIYSYGLEYHTLSIEPTHILFGPACPLYQSNKTSVTINELHNFSQITIKENNELIKAIEAKYLKPSVLRRQFNLVIEIY